MHRLCSRQRSFVDVTRMIMRSDLALEAAPQCNGCGRSTASELGHARASSNVSPHRGSVRPPCSQHGKRHASLSRSCHRRRAGDLCSSITRRCASACKSSLDRARDTERRGTLWHIVVTDVQSGIHSQFVHSHSGKTSQRALTRPRGPGLAHAS